MLLMALLSLFLTSSRATERDLIRIAVVDTGFGYKNKGDGVKLCSTGHKDFTKEADSFMDYRVFEPIPRDLHSHGTNVAGLIDLYAIQGGNNYCLIIIKFWSRNGDNGADEETMINSWNYINQIKPDIVNFSGGGGAIYETEKVAILKYLNNGGILVAAAGNESSNLDDPTKHYYPAQYDSRIIVVGNKTKYGQRSKHSNYGSQVKRWEIGEDANVFGITMTGTSQATAIATGKIVAQKMREQK